MKFFPNLITCLNLFAGCLASIMALEYHNYTGAFIFIVMAAAFDFADGFFARLLKAYSKIGADLDSLADVISFGFAPGCIVYVFLKQMPIALPFDASWLPFAGFLLPVFAALRLAKFNVDTRQTTSFIGLPVPANALFWASFIPSVAPYFNGNALSALLLLALLFVFCFLMISEIPMFSLKFKTYSWKNNQRQYILIATAIVLLALFSVLKMPLLGVCLTIVAYINMSLIKIKTDCRQ